MLKAIKITVLLALFASASAFTSSSNNVASKNNAAVEAKNVFNLQLAVIPFTTDISINWSATTNGPYQVLVYDANVTPILPLANFFTVNTFAQVNNLPGNRTYRVRVSNNFGNVTGTIFVP